MTQRIGLVAASLVMIGHTAVAADVGVIFGMELEKPFMVSECPFHKTGRGGYYDSATTGPCYQLSGYEESYRGMAHKPASTATATVTVEYPSGHVPELVIGNVIANVIDGNLEGISFNTLGIQSQARDLNVLKEKYGEPTQITHDTVQNGYGATFNPIRASWTMGNIVVSLDGAQSQANSGLIRVETLKSIAARNAFFEKLHQSRPSL